MTVAETELKRLAELAQRVVGFTDHFWKGMAERPVSAGDRVWPSVPLPEQSMGFDAAMSVFENQLAPGLSGSPGPRYWGFITGGASPAAMMGDWLVGAVDQNLSSAGDSIASSVEVQLIQWLCRLFYLPESFFGVLTTGATSANLLGMMCGRQHTGLRLGFDAAEEGLKQPIRVVSATPHASLIKSLGMAGLGRQAWLKAERLPNREAVDPESLEQVLAQAGPGAFVVASSGTVTTTDFDDLPRIAEICRRHGAWLHVDAAFGLFARALDKHDPRLAGIELADSITSDGHKWLNVPYDCGFFFTRHPDILKAVCHVGAPYLATQSQTPDFLSYGIENSRRFRALPAWFALQAYGREGVAATVANCLARAQQLANWLDAHPHYRLLAPCTLNVVLFAWRDPDRDNHKLLTAMNGSGEVFVSPGLWQGQAGIRAALSNWLTSSDDVARVCTWLDAYAENFEP